MLDRLVFFSFSSICIYLNYNYFLLILEILDNAV